MSNWTAVCQNQIVIPNNSLLYCSEKCKREDVQSSSPPLERSPPSNTSVESHSSSKYSTFEPSRKDQWGITPMAVQETTPILIRASKTRHHVMHRSSPTRPLPPLHPRTSGTSPRSMELVLPVYRGSPLSPPPVAGAKSLNYGRRVVERNTTTSGGLKKLFHFKELQATPANWSVLFISGVLERIRQAF